MCLRASANTAEDGNPGSGFRSRRVWGVVAVTVVALVAAGALLSFGTPLMDGNDSVEESLTRSNRFPSQQPGTAIGSVRGSHSGSGSGSGRGSGSGTGTSGGGNGDSGSSSGSGSTSGSDSGIDTSGSSSDSGSGSSSDTGGTAGGGSGAASSLGMTDGMGRKPNHPLYVPKGHHWRCIGEGPRKTCLLKDVFIRHGDIFLVDSSGSDTAPTRTPDVSEKDKYQYHKRLDWWPVHHYTPEEAAKLRATAVTAPTEASFLVQRFVPTNPAHTIADDMYGMYVALRKFGAHELPLRIVIEDRHIQEKLAGGKTPRSRMNDELFTRPWGGHAPLFVRSTRSTRHGANKVTHHFPFLFVGTGLLGFSGFDRNYTSPGWQEGLMLNFTNRIYRGFGLPADPGARGKPGNRKRCAIGYIHTKRVPLNEAAVVNAVRERFEARGCTVTTIKWERVKPFKAQLKLLQELDITISSVGSGAVNVMFLRPGSVHISLGFVGTVAYMEEYLYTALRHIRTLYYWPLYHELDFRVDIPRLLGLVDEAYELYHGGYPMPVPLQTNQSPVGRVCSEVFHLDEAFYEVVLLKGRCKVGARHWHFCGSYLLREEPRCVTLPPEAWQAGREVLAPVDWPGNKAWRDAQTAASSLALRG